MTLCACGCGGEIIIKPWHKWKGIPKYMPGHHICNEETKIKMSLSGKGKHNHTGKNNPNWKHGNPVCTICGKELSRSAYQQNSILCKSCCKMGIKNHMYGRCGDLAPATSRIGILNPMFGKKGKLNPRYGKPTTRPKKSKLKYSNISFRSSWELEFAKFLDSINEPWDYECRGFMLGTTTYTPDFYLPNRSLWIEIKGWWWPGYKEKFDTFLAKYPEENMKLIMHKPPYTEEDLNTMSALKVLPEEMI